MTVTGLTFSLMAGIIHPYYMVALAPGIAGLAGLGSVLLWQRRDQPVAAGVLAVAVVAAGVMAADLLGRTPTFVPWLRWVVLLGSLAAAGAVLAAAAPGFRAAALRRGVPAASGIMTRTTAVLAVGAALAGPLAYSLSTAATAQSGSIVSAGPAVSGRGGAGFPAVFGGNGGFGGGPGVNSNGTANGAGRGPGGAGRGPGGGGAGGMGGLLGATTPSAALVAALQAGAGSFTWAAAVVGSNNAAGYQLATGLPVMAVGGFNGTDPAPTLAQFQQYVADGKIHYFIAGRTMQGQSGSDDAARIASWVAANFAAQTIGGTTVYLLAG